MMPLAVADLSELIAAHGAARYANRPIATVNDHVVRLSIMTEPYFWHQHPNSDETFLVIEGEVELALDDQVIVLGEGQSATVPSGVAHRTRPLTERSINLTIERADMVTERVER
jgi:mannose-6-phosphate isomerase-like protein (cupin superfamily)